MRIALLKASSAKVCVLFYRVPETCRRFGKPSAGHSQKTAVSECQENRKAKRMRWIFLAVLAVYASLAARATERNLVRPPALAAPPALEPAAAVTALRRAGLVLYMRHPETERHQSDAELLDFGDCATQRNLSDIGRHSATRIGEAVRQIGVPIRRAVTSEYCRARETVQLMGIAGAEVDGMLNDGGRMAASGPSSLPATALRMMLRTKPPPGGNVLIVAHRPNLGDAAGPIFGDLAEGEVAVFRPSSAEPGFEAVVRIRARDWEDLLQSIRR